MAFTIVFEGDIRKFEGNPHRFKTIFGKVLKIHDGDALVELDEMEDAALDAAVERSFHD